MERLIIKFTNKYICFHSLFKVRGAWNKRQLTEGRRGRKKLKNHCSKVSSQWDGNPAFTVHVLCWNYSMLLR